MKHRFRLLLICSAFGAASVVAWLFFKGVPSDPPVVRTFAISWTGAASSWDPLDFDMANNLFVARMLYATPLEASPQGEVTSRILSEFTVSSDGRTIRLDVKPGLQFEDGTPLTAEDVAISIARMAYVRPQFPVIESIEGLRDWLVWPDALSRFPHGVSIERNRVIVRLAKAEHRPLFRLSLEPFAVIPRRCLDLRANRLACPRPPESGPYRLAKGDLGASELVFERRVEDASMPLRVRFTYPAARSSLSALEPGADPGTVVFANDLDFSDNELAMIRQRYAFLPVAKSWHGHFLLNPKARPFGDKDCRQVFADAFREKFRALESPWHSLETSIFTQLMPGYQPAADFTRPSLAPAARARALEKLRGRSITWVRRRSRQESFARVITDVCRDLGMVCSELENAQKSMGELMDDGVAVLSASTGFWPLDPLGDLQMLFTPNLHSDLKAVWSNRGLQQAIRAARMSDGSLGDLREVNRILFDDALYNVFTHHQYFYAAPKALERSFRDAPVGYAVPYPWQLFR